MPQVRSILLFKQVEPVGMHEQWWLAECYATSDGPRMRLLAPHPTEEAARTEMERRNGIITPLAVVTVEACRQANREHYYRGRRDGEVDGLSRARNRPGDGDMGG